MNQKFLVILFYKSLFQIISQKKFSSNLEFERDVIVSSQIQIKDEQKCSQIESLEEPSSTQTLKYHCSQCEYKTNKKSNHDAHIKFVHLKEEDSCPECGKQVANLHEHIRLGKIKCGDNDL